MIDSAIVVIGRDDRSSRHRKSVEELIKSWNVEGSHYTIVLDHQPYELEKAEAAGVDFQLSGHTQRGNTQFYISSGLGLWGGKFRIGTQSEYIVATLSQKSQLQK